VLQATLSSLLLILLVSSGFPKPLTKQKEISVTVRLDQPRLLNRFVPSHALGAAVDGHEQGDADRQLTPANIRTMMSAGLQSLTYRLRTELAGDAWHWNPRGFWSDGLKKEGYWTSDATSEQPIMTSYGFTLPRRGNTIDQADNNGYSRVDDGDVKNFWKSNPYLDRHFTGESNNLHPQWIVIDFGSQKKLDTIRLVWGTPFATKYEIQYGDFEDVSDLSFNPPGMWRTFPSGRVLDATGGEVSIRLSHAPIAARFVRILMTESSENGPSSNKDIRNGLGYAMREVFAGRTNSRGRFVDEVHHSADHDRQTVVYVSSTDPWHRKIDLDKQVEQPGLDRIFQSGLTNDLPMLTPTELLYGTPEDAAAELEYLKTRAYKIERVELGEEPDGQFVTPEDYGALYLQFAAAIHRVDAKLKLGGPSFQEILPDTRAQRLGNGAWLRRFLSYLQRQKRLADYSFFSFEWYPFDDVCDPVAPQLAQAAEMMRASLTEMSRRGLSRGMPWIISEYGYSAFASRAEIGVEGGLLNADIVGEFLSLGGDQVFLYGYTPGQMAKEVECTAGNNMLFSMDKEGKITDHFATYFAARLLTGEWLKPSDELHEMYGIDFRPQDETARRVVSAYGVLRPDGLWSFLLINKDPSAAYKLRIRFRGSRGLSTLEGPADLYQFSSDNYELSADQLRPHVVKSDPPTHRIIGTSDGCVLPPYSITVLRGSGPKPSRGGK
jgi:hypothetical protein